MAALLAKCECLRLEKAELIHQELQMDLILRLLGLQLRVIRP